MFGNKVFYFSYYNLIVVPKQYQDFYGENICFKLYVEDVNKILAAFYFYGTYVV